MIKHAVGCRAYHNISAAPPLDIALDQGMKYVLCAIGDEGDSSKGRQPGEQQFSRLAEIQLGGLGVFLIVMVGWQGLASRTCLLGTVKRLGRLRTCGHDAAHGEGGEEEDEQDQGIGVVDDPKHAVDCRPVFVARRGHHGLFEWYVLTPREVGQGAGVSEDD